MVIVALQIFVSYVVALVLGVLLISVLRRRGLGPWSGLLFFSLLLFFASWAGSLWIGPVGPASGGFHWLPPVIVGLIVAMLLAAATPRHAKPSDRIPEKPAKLEQAEAVGIVFGAMFWMSLVLLLALVFLGYVVVT